MFVLFAFGCFFARDCCWPFLGGSGRRSRALWLLKYLASKVLSRPRGRPQTGACRRNEAAGPQFVLNYPHWQALGRDDFS
jgi:hypothetical protein